MPLRSIQTEVLCYRDTDDNCTSSQSFDDFPAKMSCFVLGHQIKIQCGKKLGREKLQREGIKSASSVRVKYVNVFKRTGMTKENCLNLHISTDDGLNWLSGQQRKISHLTN